MEKYNYLQNVINDVRTWCEDNPETLNSLKAGEIDADEAAEILGYCDIDVNDIAAEIAEEATTEA